MSIKFHDQVIAGANEIVQIPITLSASWTGNTAPYTQTINVSGINNGSVGYLDISPSATAAQREAARDAMIYVSSQTTGSITVIADGDKPTIAIPCVITIL